MKNAPVLRCVLHARNGNGVAAPPSELPQKLGRGIGMEIRRYSPDFAVVHMYDGDYFPSDDSWTFERYLKDSEIRGYCEYLRDEAWTKPVVKRKAPYAIRYEIEGQECVHLQNGSPFLDAWDHEPELLSGVGPQLAVAGQRLFKQLFESDLPEANDREPSENKKTRKYIVEIFKEALRNEEQVITIHANCFFVPWGMLYTHPTQDEELAKDGSNFKKEGFWGYRHIVQQRPYRRPYGTERVIRLSRENRQVATGFHVDNSIVLLDDPDVVARQRELFAEHPLVESRDRLYKKDFRAALMSGESEDKIMYFFCHGQGSGDLQNPNLSDSWIQLSDPPGTRITAKDLDAWFTDRGRELKSPFIFCNACQGGQMTTNFYESFSKEMLEHGAVGLIGPQIDMPIVFAEEFGRRFFERFLGDGKTRGPEGLAGEILRDLTKEFIDNHHNPLGLAYSLYSGADVQFVPEAEQD